MTSNLLRLFEVLLDNFIKRRTDDLIGIDQLQGDVAWLETCHIRNDWKSGIINDAERDLLWREIDGRLDSWDDYLWVNLHELKSYQEVLKNLRNAGRAHDKAA